MTVIDAPQRERALAPDASFVISAPAGSGKTELLIQRYLGLLARVERPEQVLAITFTRKAAAEMRERVIEALQAATAGVPCDSPHEQRTRDLASAVLAVNAQRDWQIPQSVSRLNIRTIDGFCSTLTRQMPVLSTFGAQASPVDDATPLYAEAVAELFALADSEHPVAADLRVLMLHFDNHWDRLAELLQGLLARRDQWLTLLGMHRTPEASEQRLRSTVAALVDDVLAGLAEDLGPYLGELEELQDFAARQLAGDGAAAGDTLEPEDPAYWQRLREFLLTRGGDWRKRVTAREGFPPDKGPEAARNRAMKQRMQDLLETLAPQTSLREALLDVALLPAMLTDSASWRLVLSLSHALPMLAAQLLVVFQRHGVVDHTQVAQSALDALGEDDAPTDLALRLDYRIEHILVDEFQDTSINQFELVRRLTRGWAEHNAANPQVPRTYCIVGDGMQSIYGFRDANVGLFLRARESGFNGVLPEYLELQANFRSREGVVTWVNDCFARVFPPRDDIGRGEVSFREARAVKPASPDPAVNLEVFAGEGAAAAEVEWLCAGVSAALAADSSTTVAVLGRSRPQLQPFLQGLRQRGIPFTAQDMDRLSSSSVVLDLFTLVRALANRADRVAWLALLRAPWCGLTLADLLAVSRAGGSQVDILALAADDSVRAGLSEDGARRLAHLHACMAWAEQQRDRASLRAWTEQLWWRLGGAATAADSAALADAEQFFSLLEQADLDGRGLDVRWLEAQLERLYASNAHPASRVAVMTLHKAKGLEFDHVFIPALARASASDGRPLLLWDEYTAGSGHSGFLLAADDHSESDSPGLYNYLARQRKRKSRLENTRLLYVGATRAIGYLNLSATLGIDEKSGEPRPPGAASLLACIWPAVASQARVTGTEAPAAGPEEDLPGNLWRLAQLPGANTAASPAPGDEAQPTGTADNRPVPLENRLERTIGSVVHWALEQLAQQATLPDTLTEALLEACRWALQSAGLQGSVLEDALARVQAAVQRTLDDAQAGRWLLAADHTEAYCELPLTWVDGRGTPRDVIIDRCFVDRDSGERWVIDYKTSEPRAGEPVAEFLAQEAARYGPQLAAYRDALCELGPEPVRCALYFTALARLHEVTW